MTKTVRHAIWAFCWSEQPFPEHYIGWIADEGRACRDFRVVFAEYLRVMEGPTPKTILTEQSYGGANSKMYPDTMHRWCKWHISKKAKESLGPLYTKKNEVRAELYKIVNHMMLIDEFEAYSSRVAYEVTIKDNSSIRECFAAMSDGLMSFT